MGRIVSVDGRGETQPGARSGEAGAERLQFIQILRGMACLVVVACHYFVLFPAAPEIVARHTLTPPVTDLPQPAYLPFMMGLEPYGLNVGLAAVGLFFLTSGFGIPFSLRRHTLGGFFLRRFFRLYPVLWFVQFALLALLTFQAHQYQLSSPFSPKVIVTNFFLINSYFGYPFIEAVCWTLLIEELFYALCALCAWRQVLARPGVLIVIGLALAAVPLGTHFGFPGYAATRWHAPLHWLGKNLTCLLFIFVGVALHHFQRGTWTLGQTLPVLGFFLALYAAACCFGPIAHEGGMTSYLVSSAVALAIFVALMLAEKFLPCAAWIDRLADVSYPLYLIHGTLGYIVIRAVYLRTGSFYLGVALAFGLVLLVAALLQRYVARPGNLLGRRLASWWTHRTTAGALPEREALRRCA